MKKRTYAVPETQIILLNAGDIMALSMNTQEDAGLGGSKSSAWMDDPGATA